MTLSRARRLLLVLSCGNIICAIAYESVAQVMLGITYAVVIGQYRSLDVEGVIDKARMRAVYGNEMADEWTTAADWLVRDPLRSMHDVSHIAVALFVLNAVFLFTLWFMTQKASERPDRAASPAREMEK